MIRGKITINDPMTFVLLWHLLAIPSLVVKNLTLKLHGPPLGMLASLVGLVALFLLLQPQLLAALVCLGRRVREAPQQLAAWLQKK